jgi:hypothetical protein
VTRAPRPRFAIVALVAVLALSAIAAASAYGWWSTSGVGEGSSATYSVVALRTTASTPSGTTLVPAGSAPLVVTVTNPNQMPVVVTAVELDPDRAVGVTGSVGACVAPPLTVDATTNLQLPAGSTTTVTVPVAVTLGASAASGCQGAAFTIPVTLSGGSS